jgi:hypothetical protein
MTETSRFCLGGQFAADDCARSTISEAHPEIVPLGLWASRQ